MLDALEAADVRVGWMIPATVAERYPETVREVAARGHEIGSRGDGLEDYAALGAEEQRRAIERSARMLEEISGRRPTGFRPPSAEIGDDTAGVLSELGFTWTSLARDDDRPTLLHPATGPGAVPLVDVPAHWELNDFPRFMFNYGPAYPAGQVRIAGYGQPLDDWCAEFDAYHGYGLCCVITLEPSCIGKPGAGSGCWRSSWRMCGGAGTCGSPPVPRWRGGGAPWTARTTPGPRRRYVTAPTRAAPRPSDGTTPPAHHRPHITCHRCPGRPAYSRGMRIVSLLPAVRLLDGGHPRPQPGAAHARRRTGPYDRRRR
ncbi:MULTISPECIES: polysaccharide deacetylase family protein [Streptomyces violaceusniger group]|uniref:NodB homology domain-containing protein n=2 Tax=Streptomyces javensis TaxID=114698 RepID=A0ABN1XGB4_9ACTN|nr:polysaccharide deacetylase family protein [Streptomyces javensis]MBI0315815.1 polysaccharide deacetylase family protein [Streptomyces javensis]